MIVLPSTLRGITMDTDIFPLKMFISCMLKGNENTILNNQVTNNHMYSF